mgnify:CR=1 FL=1
MLNKIFFRLLLIYIALFLKCDSEDQTPGEALKQANNFIFQDVTEKTKLDFIHNPAVENRYAMPESMGAGAAFLDYDNDGDLDIYFINGAYRDSNKRRKPLLSNRLYQQQDDGTFIDVTESSGLGDTGYGMGVAAGDIDNDGDVDVYVTNFGPDVLYRNNGDGTFTNISNAAGIANSGWGCSAVFFDYNLDTYLDIYITNYVDYDSTFRCPDKAGRPEYCGPKAFTGQPDVLYRNNGDGTFTDVSRQSGIAKFNLAGLGVVSADFDNDHYPDIYVANDEDPNLMFINQRDGTFEEQGILMGVAFNELGIVEAGMGIAIGDIDNDTDIDLYVTHLQGESNTLYRRSSGFGFEDKTVSAGFEKADLVAYTGFGSGFLDFDHDGDLDLAVANGRIRRGDLLTKTNPAGYWDYYAEPNLLFENSGQGKFKRIHNLDDPFATHIGNSRGLAFGDVDNDGDIDMLLLNTGKPARLYTNEKRQKGNWLTVNAIDPAIHRLATGAQITVLAGANRIVRLIDPAYSYLCSNDPRAHFGLGDVENVDQIIVQWPGGDQEIFPGVKSNQFITLRKGDGRKEHER